MKVNESYVKLGYAEAGVLYPFYIFLAQYPHWLVSGASGSGKSYALLYWLWSAIKSGVEVWIADAKDTGDFAGISEHYAVGADCFELVSEFHAAFETVKLEGLSARRLLVFDEYAYFCSFLEGEDKGKYKEFQRMVREILMQGRFIGNGGGAWLWVVVQRPDADYFAKGARLNFMVDICMGAVSRETKTMMFTNDIPEDYVPRSGRGVMEMDGNGNIIVFDIPKYDKKRMRNLLQSIGNAPK